MNKKRGLLIVLSTFSLLSSCSEMCGNEIVAESVSPDRRHKLVVFTRNCGATTGFSTQASILPIYQPLLNEGGNLLIMEGKVEVRGVWQSPTQLSVNGVGSVPVFKQEPTVGGEGVTYGQ